MRAILVLLLLASMTTAGCLDDLRDRFGDIFGEEDPPVAPEPVTITGFITPGLRKNETFSVPERMSAVTVEANITMRGAPSQFPALASLDMQVRDPTGAPVGERRTMNFQSPKTTITLSTPAAGAWLVSISGLGFSQSSYGASYTIRVTYEAASA